jgi:ribosomal protein S12 methylthiotransferase accessory factor
VSSVDDGLGPAIAAALAPLGAPAAHRAAALVGALDWALALPSRSAPGFVFLAGSLAGVGVGGGGATLAEAAARLVGEAAEVLAMRAAPQPSDSPAAPRLNPGDGPGIAAIDLATGDRVAIPASIVHFGLQRGDDAPPRSLGLAAGRDRADARLRALAELIERDAAAAWWYGGGPAHAIDAAAIAPVAARLASLRAGATAPRTTVFLDLPAAVPVPVVAALSFGADGGGLAVGLKAALALEAAAEGALTELLQMEIALDMAGERIARGRATDGDHLHLARSLVPTDSLTAFPPRPPSAVPESLADLVATLAEHRLAPYVADLTPDGPFAVAKAVVPGLHPLSGGAPAAPGSPGAVAALM